MDVSKVTKLEENTNVTQQKQPLNKLLKLKKVLTSGEEDMFALLEKILLMPKPELHGLPQTLVTKQPNIKLNVIDVHAGNLPVAQWAHYKWEEHTLQPIKVLDGLLLQVNKEEKILWVPLDLVQLTNGGQELNQDMNIHGLLTFKFLCIISLVILKLDPQLFQTPLEITYIIFLIIDIELVV